MSVSIHTLLADELGISDAKAKKLLSAMLREVRKRAKAGGVHLPNLGKFKETDGRLTFSPEESLVQAVNHRFEGLASEDLGSAPMDGEEKQSPEEPSTITLGYQDSSNWSPLESEADETGGETAEDSGEAPDTAEFQVPDAEATDTAPEASSEENASPEADSASGLPTEPDPPTEPEPPSDPEPDSSGPKETEELYPLVEDVPSGSDTEASADSPSSPQEATSSDAPSPPDAPSASDTPDDEAEADPEPPPDASPEPAEPDPSDSSDDFFGPSDDREHDTLSGIWDSVDEEVEASEQDAPSPEDPTPDEAPAPSPTPSETETDSDGTVPDPSESGLSQEEAEDETEQEETTQASEAPPANDPEPTPAPAASEDDPSSGPVGDPKTGPDSVDPASGSSIPRIIVSVLVFLMLGGGAWYILGQRGMVQSPRATLSQLQSGGAGSNGSTSSVPEFAPDSSSEASQESGASAPDDAASAGSPDASEDAAASTTDPTSSTSETAADPGATAETSASEPSSSDADTATAPPQLDPAAGGWSIIVASRTDRAAAESLADTYRDRFEQPVPVGILEATVNDATRYRVGVGQFSSRNDAQTFLNEHSDPLPNGAWPTGL